ncbi:hypothetical protein FRB99_009052 [Tulasnella sp. 403]|nr:hypothetical protein FRB99_009052 [Tulasnella sp. 403]
MSDTTNTTSNKLAVSQLQDWKQTCKTKFISFNAWRIVKGKDHYSTIENVNKLDVAALWKALINHFEAKTAETYQVTITNLCNLRFRDKDHLEESFSAWGTCCVDKGNIIKNLCPGSTTTPSVTVSSNTVTTTATLSVGTLIDEFTMSTIIEGLGTSEEMRNIKHTLCMTGISTLLDLITQLKTLDNASHLKMMIHVLEESGADALTAKSRKGRSKVEPKMVIKYHCDIHGVNTTHTSEDCHNLKATTSCQGKKPKASSKRTEHGHKVIAEEEDDDDKDEEEAARLASQSHSAMSTSHTDTKWIADSGATLHMTSNCKWIRNMTPCHVNV